MVNNIKDLLDFIKFFLIINQLVEYFKLEKSILLSLFKKY